MRATQGYPDLEQVERLSCALKQSCTGLEHERAAMRGVLQGILEAGVMNSPEGAHFVDEFRLNIKALDEAIRSFTGVAHYLETRARILRDYLEPPSPPR